MSTSRTNRALLLLFVFGNLGMAAELALTGHYEDWQQWIPLALLAIGVVVGTLHLAEASPLRRRGLLAIGWAQTLAGALGVFLHLKGNWEFELEMYPNLEGWPLILETWTGATPALAPGAMALVGLLAVILSSNTATRSGETS